MEILATNDARTLYTMLLKDFKKAKKEIKELKNTLKEKETEIQKLKNNSAGDTILFTELQNKIREYEAEIENLKNSNSSADSEIIAQLVRDKQVAINEAIKWQNVVADLKQAIQEMAKKYIGNTLKQLVINGKVYLLEKFDDKTPKKTKKTQKKDK